MPVRAANPSEDLNQYIILIHGPVSIQRKAVKDFRFSDGTYVPAGNLVAVPQHAIMRDAKYYQDPDRFNPYRFYTPREREWSDAIHKFTDVSMQYPYWGAQTKPW